MKLQKLQYLMALSIVLAGCGGSVGGGVAVGRPNPDSIAATSLAAYWKFDETSGTTSADSSGGGHVLSFFNFADNTHWITGLLNGSVNFTSSLTQSAGATFYDSDAFNMKTANEFSISLWFKMGSYDPNQQYMLFWQGVEGQNCWGGGGGAATHEMCLSVNYIDAGERSDRVSFFYGDVEDKVAPAHEADILLNAAVPLSSNPGWHHVAVVLKDASTATATAELYVNGAEGVAPAGSLSQGFTDTGTQVNRSSWGPLTPDGTSTFRVGRPGVTNQRFMNGQVDEMRVFKRALTASEVLSLYQAGL